MPKKLRLLLSLALLFAASISAAEIRLTDDSGQQLTLSSPAQRIVSLAPHITELLFAANAGAKVVGVGSYSNYPIAAQTLPQVGSYDGIDFERLLALQPDLIIAWQSGNGARTIERLRSLGLNVYVSEPRKLTDIPATLEQFGQLTGTNAKPAAASFRDRLQRLSERYRSRPPVRVFYQVWNAPLMTVNGKQIISQVIRLCGGRNIFSDLPTLAPHINLEAVLAANPEAIIASEMDEGPPPWLYDWRRWPKLHAAQRDNLFSIPSDLIQRHSPRILDGAEQLCEQLELVRQRRNGR